MEDKPWLKRYDLGVPYTIDYPPVPLFYFLEESALKYPDSPCTIFKGARISYREMNELSDRLAAGLASLGIKKGDRVGLFMPNTPQFVMAYFAILKVGGVVVATNPLYSPKEIEHQVNDSGIEVMLVMSNFYNLITKVQPNTKIRSMPLCDGKPWVVCRSGRRCKPVASASGAPFWAMTLSAGWPFPPTLGESLCTGFGAR